MSRNHVTCASFALAAVMGACASTDPAAESNRAMAKVKFDIGDYPEAVKLYTGLSGEGDVSETSFACLQKGKSLYYLGRYDEALECFEKIPADKLDPQEASEREILRDSCLFAGHCELGLGHRAEAPFLPNTPERRSEIDRRSAQASRHYEKAQIQYERILEKYNARDFEALVSLSECFLRQGLLNHSNQYFYKARTHLDKCLAKAPDDERVLFLDGRLIQEDLGRGVLTSDAGDRIIRAMLIDASGNHDFHVAYRDMLVYVRRFAEPPDVQKAFQGADGDEATKKRHMLTVIDQLRDYWQTGRPSTEEWVVQFRQELGTYIDHYDNYGRTTRGSEQNIARADEVARDTTGDNLSTERFRAAMGLLSDVPKQFVERDDYKKTRRIVQTAYVKSLLRDAEDLVHLGEWDLANQAIREAQRSCENSDFLIGGEDARLEFIVTGQRLNDQRAALGRWEKEERHIREQLDEGRVEEAKRNLTLAIDSTKPESRQMIEKNIGALKSEVDAAISSEMRRELAQSWQRAQSQTDAEALQTLQAGLAQAEASQNAHWRNRLQREIAWMHYRLGDYDQTLAALATLVGDTDGEGEQGLDERERFLAGLCLFRQNHVSEACVKFDGINTAVIKEDGELKQVGLAYLQNDQPAKAEFFLTRVEKKDAESTRGLTECYVKMVGNLMQSDRRDTKEAQRVLTELIKLDPKNGRAQLELGLLCYDLGKIDQSAGRFREAYEHMAAAAAAKDGQPRNEQERQCLGRLTACFGDYLPLGVGKKWEYVGPSGEARTIEVLQQDVDGKYEVKITEVLGGRSTERTERWVVEEGLQKRFDAAGRSRVDVPIRLRFPEPDTFTWSYTVIATKYTAQVVGTGVTVTEGNAGTWNNCLHVRLLCDNQEKRDVFFAPGVGEVKSVEAGVGSFVLKGTPPQARGEGSSGDRETTAALASPSRAP